MAYGAPKLWWDLVLDGRLFKINLRDTGFTRAQPIRQMAYREAYIRDLGVRTKQADPRTMYIKSFGSEDWVPHINVLLRAEEPTVLAPPLSFKSMRLGDCDCRQPQGSHALECAIWGKRSTFRDPLDPVDPDDMSGDCTCGQYPRCAPTCYNATGIRPTPPAVPADAPSGQDNGHLTVPADPIITANDLADDVPGPDGRVYKRRTLSQEALAQMFPGLKNLQPGALDQRQRQDPSS